MYLDSDSLVQLATSGGWVGEGTILVSDLLGVWDIFVLCVLFILSWVIMRTAYMEISFMLGLVYDLGIPLQYVCESTDRIQFRCDPIRYRESSPGIAI